MTPGPLHVWDHTGTYDDVAIGALDQCRKMLLGQHLRVTHCLSQLSEAQVWWRPREEMNSIGNLLLHLTGNVGQWIIAGVGGRSFTRNRSAEFAAGADKSRAEAEETLNRIILEAADVLTTQDPATLLIVRRVQEWDVTGLGAMLHAAAHFEGHVQEIVCLTRQQLGPSYRSLWQPQATEQTAQAIP